MDAAIINSAIRFVLLWLLQVFVFKQIELGWGGQAYVFVILYPLFIMLLPFNAPRSLVILLSFVLGLSIDMLYETLGVHAAAATFTAFVRPLVLRFIAPREGYNPKAVPTKDYLGSVLFLRYAGIMLFLHLFFYFSVQAFTFAYIVDILLRTFFSWVVSLLLLLAAVFVFNPRA